MKNLKRNVYYISSKGNDERGDGSRHNPFRTIQKALDVSKEYGGGEDFRIESGTYRNEKDK